MEPVVDLRVWKSVLCVAVLTAAGCAGHRASTIPDADRVEQVSDDAEALDEKPTGQATIGPPVVEVAVPVPTGPAPETERPEAEPSGTVPSSTVPSSTVVASPGPPEPVVLPPDDPSPTPGEQRFYSAEVCPVGIPGLAVRAENARGGAELVFTAEPLHRRALRERMARFAELHRQARRAHAGDTSDPPATFGDEDAQIHHAEVQAVPTAEGVRLVARADRPADIRALQHEIEEDAGALGRGACPLALEIVG